MALKLLGRKFEDRIDALPRAGRLASFAADHRPGERRRWRWRRGLRVDRRWRRRGWLWSAPREERRGNQDGNHYRITQQPAAGQVFGDVRHSFLLG